MHPAAAEIRRTIKPPDVIFTWVVEPEGLASLFVSWGISLFTDMGPSHIIQYCGLGVYDK